MHNTVIVVCRQWFSLKQHVVIRELSWNDSLKTNNTRRLDKLISHLPTTTHLKWTSGNNSLVSKDAQRIFQALQELNANKDQTSIRGNSDLRAANLTELDPFLFRTLAYLPAITVLRLCIFQYNSVGMECTLQTCPRLQTLQLDSPSAFYLQANRLSSSSNDSPETGSPTLPLRSHHLENACFSQSSLEFLLEVTPSLKHLQLRNLRRQGFEEEYNRSRLYKVPTTEATEETLEKVLMIRPQATKWSFRSLDLTPILKQCLNEPSNVVTTHNLTFHIEVHNLGSPAHQTSPIRTRVLFGYISRVCLNLRELELWEPDIIPGFCLELDGGFCLLARLHLLEYLPIGSGKNLQVLKPRDLKWITKSG
ncbi:hypothetical protein BGZ47_008887 [Haplosporangium gracile]|nr:hypothetical protein BGZ47_008887 [Haplosporangium gracile]